MQGGRAKELLVYIRQFSAHGGVGYRWLSYKIYGFTDDQAIRATRATAHRLRDKGLIEIRQKTAGTPALLFTTHRGG